ncbi:MAG: chloride channel protein [Gammaproteobacteria bacterium]|jgi:H+/Cl- antiporter ClcA
MPYRLRSLFSLTGWKTRLVFWVGAIAVGGIAAGFALGAEQMEEYHRAIVHESPYLPLLLTPLGLMMATWLTRRIFPGSHGSGIPQAIAALHTGSFELRQKVLSLRIAVGKILITLLGLLSGATIGREGPTVHVGAALMYSLGRAARFPHRYLEHGLILAGGAAGISAAFNTPIAGIMFAIEELARTFEERSSGTLLTAVIVAGVMTIALQGNYTYFGNTSAVLENPGSWIAVPICGVIGGLIGGAFSAGIISGTKRIAPHLGKRPMLVAGLLGLALAGLGILTHGNSYGAGYVEAKAILTSSEHPGVLYPLSKMLATMISYLSGIPGGIFAPSLAAGAGLGQDLAPLIPSAPIAAVVILGMVAYFTGVVQTPITGAVIVMEMVNNHGMVLPIMATAFIAFGASKLVCRKAIYEALAEEFSSEEARQEAEEAAEVQVETDEALEDKS